MIMNEFQRRTFKSVLWALSKLFSSFKVNVLYSLTFNLTLRYLQSSSSCSPCRIIQNSFSYVLVIPSSCRLHQYFLHMLLLHAPCLKSRKSACKNPQQQYHGLYCDLVVLVLGTSPLWHSSRQ